MHFPSTLAAFAFAAALGSAAVAGLPAEVRQEEPPPGNEDAFFITRAFLTSPSPRPGSYQYCSIQRE